MTDYGIAISKDGESASNPGVRPVFKMSLWSKYLSWKIKSQGTVTCDFVDGQDTKTIEVNHGIAYWPQTVIFWEDTDGKVYPIDCGNAESDDSCNVKVYKLDPYCVLQFHRNSSVGADSMYAYYYFFVDELYNP